MKESKWEREKSSMKYINQSKKAEKSERTHAKHIGKEKKQRKSNRVETILQTGIADTW